MITILKIPHDSSIVESHRRGASDGPDALQKELLGKGLWKDVKIDEGDFANTLETIRKSAKKEYDKNNFVIGVGGDHSISYGLVKAFLEKHPEGGLIVFDAHFDCMDNFYPPTHEDWLRVLIENDKFSKVLLLGARKSHKIEREFAEKNKLAVSRELNLELKKILEFLKSTGKIKGMDLVEVSPPKDVNNITNKVAVSLLSVFF